MTDKELLELAAKAAGMVLNRRDGWVWCENVGEKKHWGLWRDVAQPTENKPNPRFLPGCWNPLTDDGDALRLVVRLVQLHGFFHFMRRWIANMRDENGNASDPCEATRRAIVRAAAIVGASIPVAIEKNP